MKPNTKICTDAKIYVMINDMSRVGLLDALAGYRGHYHNIGRTTAQLRARLRYAYEHGRIPSGEIAWAWETDEEHQP